MSLFLEPMLYIFILSNSGFQWGYDCFGTTIVDLGLQKGSERVAAVNLLTYFGAADLFGNSELILHMYVPIWG